MTCTYSFFSVELDKIDNYIISDESAYSLLFVSGSCLFAEENEPKPYKLISQFSVPITATVVF